MLVDADLFSRRISPALAASWQQRSFEPCRPLCTELMPAALAFGDACHTDANEALLCKIAQGLPFDRHFWQVLVGEVLLYGAAELPQIQIAPETLCCLLAPGTYRHGEVRRGCFAAIQQVHFGTRLLLFGTRCYRPECAGYNDIRDVVRLAEYLAAQMPETWTVADLAELRDMVDDEERQEELEFAQESFPALCEMYQRAKAHGQLVVCEVF